mgnify:CR=1 FL=1
MAQGKKCGSSVLVWTNNRVGRGSRKIVGEMRGAKEKKIKKRDKDTHTTTTTTLACTGGMGPLELLRSGLNPAKQLEVGLCPTGLQCTGRKGCSEHLHLAGTVSRNSHEE